MSTYGIPQIVTRVRDFANEIGESIAPLGIVVTKFQSNSSVHANVLRNLRAGKDAPVFDTIIPQANAIAGAAEYQAHKRTLKQKYGYRGLPEACRSLAQAIIAALEARAMKLRTKLPDLAKAVADAAGRAKNRRPAAALDPVVVAREGGDVLRDRLTA